MDRHEQSRIANGFAMMNMHPLANGFAMMNIHPLVYDLHYSQATVYVYAHPQAFDLLQKF